MKKRVGHINLSSFPQKRDSEGRLICLNCGKRLEGQRTKYCNDECSNDWLCKHSHQFMRAKLIRICKGVCKKCGNYSDDLIMDHIIPIALGGEEFDRNNLQILCRGCDKIKTKQDVKDIAKLRRKEKILDNGKQKQLTGDKN